jgi:hypothetical protein
LHNQPRNGTEINHFSLSPLSFYFVVFLRLIVSVGLNRNLVNIFNLCVYMIEAEYRENGKKTAKIFFNIIYSLKTDQKKNTHQEKNPPLYKDRKKEQTNKL